VSLPCFLSFRVLTCPSLCALQLVSASHSLAFFPCPHLSLGLRSQVCECPLLSFFLSCPHLSVALCSPVRECPPTRLLSFGVLTCPSLCALQGVSAPHFLAFFRVLTCPSLCDLQDVSAPRSLAFFPRPHLSVARRSPGSECPSLARFLSVSSPVCRSALSRE
jgi:hypothetical protein